MAKPSSALKRKPEGKRDGALGALSASDFLSTLDARDEDESISQSEEEEEEVKPTKGKLAKKAKPDAAASKKRARQIEEEEEDAEEDEEEEDEEELHKRELAELAKKDPAFHAHLQAEAKGLLEFGHEDDDEEEEEEDEDLDDEEGEEGDSKAQGSDDLLASLDEAGLEKLTRGVQKHDPVAIRNLVKLFRSSSKTDSTESSDLQSKVVSLALDAGGMDVALVSLLYPVKAGKSNVKPSKEKDPGSSPHFKRFAKLIKAFLSSLTRMISSSSGNPELQRYLLQASASFVPYYAADPLKASEGRRYLKAVVMIFGAQETEGPTRVASFFRLRQLGSYKDKYFLEDVLKASYTSFARGATSSLMYGTQERVAVQTRCLVELFAVEPHCSYRVAFGFVRQLALHLRAASVSNQSEEAIKSIDSWQYINCLRVWGFCLAKNTQGNLPELIFPVVQISLGTCQLLDATRHLPLRVQALEVAHRLVKATGQYAALAPRLLEMLFVPDWFKSEKPISAGDKVPEIDAILRLKPDALRVSGVRQAVFTRVLATLRDHLRSHRRSVAFPEIWAATRARLVKWSAQAQAVKNPSGKPSGSGKKSEKDVDAFYARASSAMAKFIKDGDRWSRRVRDARDGLVPTIKRPRGPADREGCERFERELKVSDDEEEANEDDVESLGDEEDAVLSKISKKAATEGDDDEEEEEDDEVEQDDDDDEAASESDEAELDDDEEDEDGGVEPLDTREFFEKKDNSNNNKKRPSFQSRGGNQKQNGNKRVKR